MIAITGATGAVGRRVVELLARDEQPLRLLVRDPARAPEVRAEIAPIRDYRDLGGLRAGFAGCHTALVVSARESADRVAEHRAVVESAVAAGVTKVVYLSFQGASPTATFTFARDHWHTEQLIRASGLRFVFLRDNLYLAALAGLAGSDGVIRGPAGLGAAAGVAHDDVAAVAARVLVDPSWDGRYLDVTGPAALTLEEVAAGLTSVSGREVTYQAETVEQAYQSRAIFEAPPFEVAGWVSSYEAIAAGELAAVSDTVHQVTGHRPQPFTAFLRAHPSAWAQLSRT